MTTAQRSTPVTFRANPTLLTALEMIQDVRHKRAPLLPRPTISQVLRELVSEEHRRITSKCPFCNGDTAPHPDPAMAGVRYCPTCKESVGYVPDNGAARPQAQAVQ
jgi:hypothetical protein